MSESHRGEVGKDEKILLEKKGLLRGSHLLCGGHLNRDLNDINSLKWCLLSALIKEYCCLLINKKNQFFKRKRTPDMIFLCHYSHV